MDSHAIRRWIPVMVLLIVVPLVGGSAAGAQAVTIVDVSHSGDAVVGRVNEVPRVVSWRPHGVSVTVEDPADGATVCLGARAGPNDTRSELACAAANANGSLATTKLTVPAGAWPAGGAQPIEVVVSDANGTTLASATTTVHVLGPTGDADDDGLANRDETEVGTDLLVADTDGDGLTDGDEYNVHDTDPLDTDTDDDGLSDGVEQERGTNPRRDDTDDDGLADSFEVTTAGTDPTNPDTDDDGVPDGRERTLMIDPTSVDSDEDELPDGEEVRVHETMANRSDTDGDGLADGREVDLGTNPNVPDTDGDGLSDRREVTDGLDPTSVDSDEDGINDSAELERGLDPSSNSGRIDLSRDRSWLPLLAAGIGSLLLGAIGAVWWYRRRDVSSDPNVSEMGRPEDRPERNEPEPADPDSADPGSNAAEAISTIDGEVVVSSADRIERLLDEHGGRMRQAEIVDALDWSKSKVSRVLSRMEEQERVRKVRLGRENLIILPGREPEGVAPPE